MLKAILFASVLLIASRPELLVAQTHSAPSTAPRLVDRFDRGIPSWQSFPLAQDIGYDPSVYTEPGTPFALVRDVINEGEKENQIGLIRSLNFHATAHSRVEVAYSTLLAGELVSAKIILVAKDGSRFEAPLPLIASSQRTLAISGTELKIPQRGADIEAVVVLYATRKAPLRSHSFLKLTRFALASPATDALTLVSPRVTISSTRGIPVAEGAVIAGTSSRFVFSKAPQKVVLKNGEGVGTTAKVSIVGNAVEWTPTESVEPGLWTLSAMTGNSSIDVRVLVLPTHIASHGGGILSTERLRQLKGDEAFATLRSIAHREAQRRAKALSFDPNAGDSIALLPKESVHAALPDYINMITSYGDAIAWSALDYKLNGSKGSLETTRKALKRVEAWKTWTPPWFTTHGISTYYVVGVFTERLAFGYNLVADQLSTQERDNFSTALMDKSIKPTLDDYYFADRMPTGASNHMAHSVGGAIAVWTTLDASEPEWRARHSTELAELIVAYEDLLRGLFPGDGSEAEPAGYENFAMEGMSYGIAALNSLGISPKGTKDMLESFWWLRYAEATPSLVLDTGDTRADISRLYGFAWVVEHGRNADARRLYDSLKPPLTEISGAPNLLDLICCTSAAPAAEASPVSRIFPLRGSAVLRSGWAATDTTLSLRTGAWLNHEHHDQGSFQLAAGGELLIGEGGYADYYHDPNYKNFFSQAAAHNTVLIDHDPFSQVSYDGRYWKAFSSYPRMDKSLLTNAFDYIEANLQPAYGSALKSFRRRFVFVKPSLVVIEDNLQSTSPHVFTWQVRAAAKASTKDEGTVATMEGSEGKGSATLLSGTAGEVWSISRTPNATHDFTNMAQRSVQEHLMVSTDSSRTARKRFLEAISVNEGKTSRTIKRFATSTGDGFIQESADTKALVLARKAVGPLAAEGWSTDGDLLVVSNGTTGERHILATHARVMAAGANLSVQLSRPQEMCVDETGKETVITVQSDSDVELNVTSGGAPRSLLVDGHAESAAPGGKGVLLKPGTHQIHFSIRAD